MPRLVTVIVTFPDGSKKEYDSYAQACRFVGGSAGNMHHAAKRGGTHMGCTVKSHYRNPPTQSSQTLYCPDCDAYYPRTRFYKDIARTSGRSCYCVDCTKRRRTARHHRKLANANK